MEQSAHGLGSRDSLQVVEEGLMGELWIRARDVTVRYDDDAPVLSGVDFTLHKGESVLLIGPSGCGKSTLAMLCAGLIPKVVEASVEGQWFAEPRLSAPGGVGYVFQDADAQFCMLSVADEMAFGLENLRVPQEEMTPSILRALSRAGLPASSEELRRAHSSFSGGMKQKLAIACALAMNADLLVLDEPTANLDPFSSRQVFNQIAQLHHKEQTMLIIEHKFDALIPYVDTVVLFASDGRIHRQGPVKQVLAKEWDWLIREGIVAPWKEPPLFSGPDEGPTSPALTTKPNVGFRSNAHPSLENSEAAIALRDVCAGYLPGTLVWRNVNVDVTAGSITAIVGPNGSGKTTLLQVMAGLREPTSGEVRRLGEPPSPRRRRKPNSSVSYCFQNPEFQFIFERVVDELSNQAGVEEVSESVTDLLDRFGLTKVAHQSPYALSQGQKRRLSVATMLRQPHDLYFLDEPTFGQDSSTQAAIMAELMRLQQSGKTIVLTTHDMDLVRRYASGVIVVADGGVLFTGDVEELFDRPDVMSEAHLLDDLACSPGMPPTSPPSFQFRNPDGSAASSTELCDEERLDEEQTTSPQAGESTQGNRGERRKEPAVMPNTLQEKSPLLKLNPAWHLLSIFVAVMLTIGAHTVTQAGLIFAFPIVLMLGLLWMNLWRLLRRYAVFLLFYVFYLGTYMAYSRIPPGTVHVIHILWLHADWYGFRAGLILALRMLGAVGLGLSFLSATDLTVFASALCQSMRVPPRFSYGLMAGAHFMPLFQEEWRKLRLARRLRGREGRFWSRPVLYALPILSQAIRMSERVAIAMEARGFVGETAASSRHRTYYRRLKVRAFDIAYDVLLPGVIAIILVFVR